MKLVMPDSQQLSSTTLRRDRRANEKLVWQSVPRLVLLGILVSLIGCGPTANEADLTPQGQFWQTESDSGHFNVTIAPMDGQVRVGEFQDWRIDVRSTTDASVGPARIALRGGMPDHGHGLPTQPQVTESLGPGSYRIEGMRLNMAGMWLLEFRIETSRGTDRASFSLEIDL